MSPDRSRRSEWFRDWFNEDYTLVYGHRTDEEAENFVAQWPLWNEKLPSEWCLDFGCGGGRFARSMAKRGLKTVGVDLSFALLNRAKETPCVGVSPRYVRADIRRPPFRGGGGKGQTGMSVLPGDGGKDEGGFGLIASLFTSFGYFETDREHLATLRGWAELLRPGGYLILDLPNRDSVIKIDNVAGSSRRERLIGQTRVVESWRLTDDYARVEKEIAVGDEPDVRHYRESVRLFSQEDITGMTAQVGLEPICQFWGDYQGGGMTAQSTRMIYFGRKRG